MDRPEAVISSDWMTKVSSFSATPSADTANGHPSEKEREMAIVPSLTSLLQQPTFIPTHLSGSDSRVILKSHLRGLNPVSVASTDTRVI
jgi:hypothetical protein